VDEKDSEGFTPLMMAISYGIINCFRELLRRGANVNSVSEKGMTPLLLLGLNSRKDNEEISYKMTEELMEAGAGRDPKI
jgi:ankyrin repeat protein